MHPQSDALVELAAMGVLFPPIERHLPVRSRARKPDSSVSQSAELRSASSLDEIIGLPIEDVNRPADHFSQHDGLMLRDRVKQMRLARKMSQGALAHAIGISQPALSDIESGRTKTLHSETLMRMAKLFGEDPEYIRTGSRRQLKDSLTGSGRAAELFDQLEPADQVTWLAMGRVLLEQRASAQIVRKSGPGEDKQDRLVKAVLNQLAEILKEHGPDGLAGILDHLSGATQKQGGAPTVRTRKTKA